jgi:hypothetical protein
MLPRTSPTKAMSGVAIVSASRQSPLEVSDRRPAPTKATPPRALTARNNHYPRPLKLGKFKSRFRAAPVRKRAITGKSYVRPRSLTIAA